MNITERANKGISFAFQQPIRFKGITVRDLIGLAAGKEISDCQACSYLKQVGLCAKDRPRGQRKPFRRRNQTNRDCHCYGA